VGKQKQRKCKLYASSGNATIFLWSSRLHAEKGYHDPNYIEGFMGELLVELPRMAKGVYEVNFCLLTEAVMLGKPLKPKETK